ncbi:hypothetical protein C8J56DRAFT_1045033 [Mycena floridula]|nr:hypothetical protein C8J56DRAFT_1045033 [Mycena floridula]
MLFNVKFLFSAALFAVLAHQSVALTLIESREVIHCDIGKARLAIHAVVRSSKAPGERASKDPSTALCDITSATLPG